MAIAQLFVESNGGDTANVTAYTANVGATTLPTNSLVVVAVTNTHGTAASSPTSVTGTGGIAFTKVNELNGTSVYLSVWVGLNLGAAIPSFAVTANFAAAQTGAIVHGLALSGTRLDGTNGVNALRGHQFNFGAGTTAPTLTLGAFEFSTNWTYAAFTIDAAAAITKEHTFYANQGADTYGTPARAMLTEWLAQEDTGPSATTAVSRNWMDMAAEIRQATVPVLTTTAPSAIKTTGATLGGNVSDAGGRTITERGVVLSRAANPTTTDTKLTVAGTTGAFSTSPTNLPQGLLHTRAFATNDQGTAYGADQALTVPTTGFLAFQ